MNPSEIMQAISYFLKFDSRCFYYWKIKNNIKLTKQELIEMQSNKLKKLISNACSTTPFYKDYFQKNKLKPEDIKSESDLTKLPVMTKQIIKENIEQLKSTNYKKLIKVTSGGSTGEESVVYKSPYFLQMSRAASMRNFIITGWFPSDKSVWIWGAPYEHQQIKSSVISRIGMVINKRLLLNAYDYSPADFPVWIGRIKKFKPKVLYGYSSIILEFAKWCVANKVSLDSIKIVVSTTEKLADRASIEQAFKCKVYDQYGCREILSIATECRCGNMHSSDDTVIVEQASDNRLLITALDSFGFPLIRYEVGDTGTKIDAECPCGLKLSLMGLEIGRTTDNFIRPGGRKISSSALATYISTLGIKFLKYQLVQKEINKFEVKYIRAEKTSEEDKIKFTNAIEEYFGKSDIVFIETKEMPPEKSGKRLLFKCLIKDYENTSNK